MNALDAKAQGPQGSDGRFASNTGPLHKHVKLPKAEFLGLVGRTFGRRLGRERSGLFGPTETQTAGRRPREGITSQIGHRNNGIVKRCLDKDVPFEDNLLFFLLLRFGQNNSPDYFFLFATVLRLPFLVRAFVFVRWPRTGRPLR